MRNAPCSLRFCQSAAGYKYSPGRWSTCRLPFIHGNSGSGVSARPTRTRVRGGKNIVFDYRYGEGKREQYRDLADELVRLKPDIIVVSSTGFTRAAKEATKTIPIV